MFAVCLADIQREQDEPTKFFEIAYLIPWLPVSGACAGREVFAQIVSEYRLQVNRASRLPAFEILHLPSS